MRKEVCDPLYIWIHTSLLMCLLRMDTEYAKKEADAREVGPERVGT